jgi:hypothetical protein
VVTLSTGKVNWQSIGDASAIRIDGQPYVVNDHGDRTDVRRGRTGEVVGSDPLPAARSTRIAGGALYQTDVDEVRAFRLPELAGQWVVPLPAEAGPVSTPIPHGFVVENLTNSVGHLIGYLG